MEEYKKETSLLKKSSPYYSQVNMNIIRCINGVDNIILDIGCAYGLIGKALKASNKARIVVGVEINPDAAAIARENLDEVLCINIEENMFNYDSYFDYIILSHVLEHMRDPLKVLTKLKKDLKDSGKIIIALPNIKYWKILRDLIFFDKWEYTDAGILDIDHKWFFTHTSAKELLRKAHYKIDDSWVEIDGPKRKVANVLTVSIFKSFLSKEIYIVGSKKL